jgi:hypothetical protein
MRTSFSVGRVLAVGLSAALSFLPMACGGGDSKLDTDGLETQMKETLSDRTGIAIESVGCPDEVEPKKGASFRCTARTEKGERVVLNVTQDDADGAVTWKVVRGPR